MLIRYKEFLSIFIDILSSSNFTGRYIRNDCIFDFLFFTWFVIKYYSATAIVSMILFLVLGITLNCSIPKLNIETGGKVVKNSFVVHES